MTFRTPWRLRYATVVGGVVSQPLAEHDRASGAHVGRGDVGPSADGCSTAGEVPNTSTRRPSRLPLATTRAPSR